MPLPRYTATIVRGHRVASGGKEDPRFPGGTLAMQIPHFQKAGLDLSDWHRATLNVSISPLRYEIVRPRVTFRSLRWHPTEPAEDFSFFDCTLNGREALIYYPHPETKPEHEQPDDVLELWVREFVPGLSYGDRVELTVSEEQMRFLAV